MRRLPIAVAAIVLLASCGGDELPAACARVKRTAEEQDWPQSAIDHIVGYCVEQNS